MVWASFTSIYFELQTDYSEFRFPFRYGLEFAFRSSFQYQFMKTYLFIAISLFSLQVFGQQPSQPYLHVSGQAQVAVKPTLSVVTLSIRSSSTTYAGTVEDLINRVDVLVTVLKQLKFKDQEIFTSNFSVDKNYIYDKGERKEKGFNGQQTLKVQFEQDKERLLKVLTSVANSNADPEIAVSFDLDGEQKEKLKNELIKQAVKDAHTKAQLIASQSNHQITGIKDIKYGVGSSNFPEPPVYADFQAESRLAVEVSNFEAADLTFSDQVQIVFKIAPK